MTLETTQIDVNPTGNKAGRPKSIEKRKRILDAATDLFLANGVSSTSMDMVATTAGVSKQTVYSHFNSKDDLFAAVISQKCGEYQLDKTALLDPNREPKAVLHEFGSRFVSLLRDKQVIAMHRIVIAEGASNPRVAEIFYESGPVSEINLLTEYFYHSPHFTLSEDMARHAAVCLLNLLKGHFHFTEMLSLPCDLSEIDESEHVSRTLAQFFAILDHQAL
ncbi:TetR/AcrR family transcriptional regulator [Aestuariibacter sp. AA17]|uniref:TetR/AcrR family transcriptional regulator n=1 Tax=Fluctibacter corallii TaxID=2984329 RepID=A0ABT3ACP4_9ALTE|nr:TetR/AcrR family transcriptional regulator [Aestuariibacter sp. AA17]MCV2886451.1 TetR/AcrR family transcriptional regulator [Aestuariibacter sp. AA17]